MNPADQRFVHRLDDKDRVIFVNEDWLAFAKENSASHLTQDEVLEKPLWSFMTGGAIRHLYETLLSQVRTSRQPMRMPFRCDAPTHRRFFEMEIVPLPQRQVEFRSRIVRLELRKPVNLLKADVFHSAQLLRMCSWCKKVFLKGSGWIEVEQAITILRLFDNAAQPRITHGLCSDCCEQFLKQLAA
jgi:ribosomal protein L24E